MVGLTGTEDRRGKFGTIGRVGEMLGFQAETVVLLVGDAVGLELAVEEVPVYS